MYEVWIAGQRNGTKLGIEVFDDPNEALEFAGKMLERVEVELLKGALEL